MPKPAYPIEEGQARAEQNLILEAVQLRERVKRLLAEIEKAPHDKECSIHPPGLEAAHHRMELKYNGVQRYCDCWKSKVLENPEDEKHQRDIG